MRLRHEEIKEMLPEYLKGTLSSETASYVKIHVEQCEDCREELELVGGILGAETPDPGELFWKTLPKRIRTDVTKEQSSGSLFRWLRIRPVAFASALAVLLMIAVFYVQKRRPVEYDPFFKDPLSSAVLDYSVLQEKDIPPVMVESPEDAFYSRADNFAEAGYRKELAYLDSAEMERLICVLESQRRSGG